MNVRKHMQWLVDPKEDLKRLATGGAWLFAIGSLVPLLFLIWLSGGGLLQAGYVFDAAVNGKHYSMPLLAYSGWPGMLLIWGELLAVSGAILLTAFPRYVPLRWRHIGHMVLVGWSALWTFGTWRLALVSWPFGIQAAFVSILAGCTVWRAWRNWTPMNARPAASPATRPPGESPAESNYFVDVSPSPPAESQREQITAAVVRARVAAVAASRKIAAGLKGGIEAARRTSAQTHEARAKSRAATPPRV